MSKPVLQTLSKLSWRGIVVPSFKGSFGFSQESAEQKYVFRDEALIQSLGKKNNTFRYTIPFREGIIYSAGVPYNQKGDIFSKTFKDFKAACENRDVGNLQDPIVGLIPAKVAQFSYDYSANMLDGVDVEVEFIHCPDVADIDPSTIRQGAPVQVGNLDNALAKVDWKQQEPPTAFLDPFSALSSILDQSAIFVSEKTAAIDNLLFKVQKANNSIDSLKDAKNNDVKRLGENFKQTLIQTRRTVGSAGQVTRDFFTPRETTIGQLALSFQMTNADFIRLNPELARNPKVKSGTKVRYIQQS